MYIQKKWLVLCIGMLVSGCAHNNLTLVSERYPAFKWGFTTQSFIESTPVSVESAKEFIDYARKQGFSWIELRDPEASLSVQECKAIASFAELNNIEINYAVQIGLLESDFWRVFPKAVENGAVFEGPGYCRTLAVLGEGEFGWTKKEFNRLVETANKASSIAKGHGMQLTVENADTDIDGYGKPYYGLSEFFEQTEPEVTLQLDTANLFTNAAQVTAEEAEAFIKKYASRISYLHLKSAKQGEPLAILDGNPLDFERIFSIVAEANVKYIAIELNAEIDERQVYKNMEFSMAYLLKKGILSGDSSFGHRWREN